MTRPMQTNSPLYQRSRPLTNVELDAIPWLSLLAPTERQRALDDLRIADADPTDTSAAWDAP